MLLEHILVKIPLFHFQDRDRSTDQIDGTGMSLGHRKGVRVSGKHVAPADWSNRGGLSIVHSPNYTPVPTDAATVISISPVPHQELSDDPRTEGSAGTDWTKESRGNEIPLQTMKELKSILRDSAIRGRDDVKPRGAYTYLHGSRLSRWGSAGSGQSNRREDDETPQRPFSTFKPKWDASRREARSRDSTSIESPPSVDSSSSFRPVLNTNRLQQADHLDHSGTSYRENTAHQPQTGQFCFKDNSICVLSRL